MSKRDCIRSAISNLHSQIAEYNSNIDELSDAKSRLILHCENAKSISSVIDKYDNTREDRWLGNLNNEAYEVQVALSANVSSGARETDEFIAGIDNAIERLREKISDCENEIAALECELECCDDEDTIVPIY